MLGGGFAGLCAARALSRHYARITVIERDTLPDTAAHRPGVPQSHHVHALLLRGLAELERLFPGIEQDLVAEGARRMDLGGELAHFSEWGWAPREQIGVAPLTVSRLVIEHVIRTRVKRDVENASFLENTRVRGFVVDQIAGRKAVVGVRTSRPESPLLLADLIVDATGRTGKGPEWLAGVGVTAPPEEVVDAHAGYASRFYELPPEAQRWWRAMVIDPKPPAMRRWGLLMPLEQGRFVLTLAGLDGDVPPSDEAGFHEFLRSLRAPELSEVIAQARPISEIRTHRSLMNRARRLDRWEGPDGFIAIGDAAVAFNASHGQGMSMAAWCARTLDDTLARVGNDPARLPPAFHRAQWKVLARAWDIATGADLQWQGTEGKRPFGFALMHKLAVACMRAAHDDPRIKQRFGPVFHLLVSPYVVLQPHLLLRILLVTLRRSLGRPALATPSAPRSHLPSDTGPHAALGSPR